MTFIAGFDCRRAEQRAERKFSCQFGAFEDPIDRFKGSNLPFGEGRRMERSSSECEQRRRSTRLPEGHRETQEEIGRIGGSIGVSRAESSLSS